MQRVVVRKVPALKNEQWMEWSRILSAAFESRRPEDFEAAQNALYAALGQERGDDEVIVYGFE